MRIEITEVDMSGNETFSNAVAARVIVFDGETITATTADYRDMKNSWTHEILLAVERCIESNHKEKYNNVEIE